MTVQNVAVGFDNDMPEIEILDAKGHIILVSRALSVA